MNGRGPLAAAAAWLLVPLLVLGACASDNGPRRFRDRDLERAVPSTIVAAELALAREAFERGQWTAFADRAASDALWFAPEPVPARAWLQGQPNPAVAARRQPHRIVMSCDGRLAAASGVALSPDDARSRYLTLWQRSSVRDDYRWLLHREEPAGAAPPASGADFISTQVADCSAPTSDPAAADGVLGGQSPDGTLRWSVGQGSAVETRYWDGSAWRDAFEGDGATP